MSAARLDRTLAALAAPGRRRIVDLLCERPYRAGELAGAMRTSFPAVSRHLRALRESGLVDEQRDALDSRVRVYSLRAQPMAELKAWLEQTERAWAEQLVAFRTHMRKAQR
jgi:DNA-binding transcriptional ArsR family regulator